MRVSIKTTPKAAAAEIAKRLGTSLEAMHPGVDDEELSTYFYADVDDDRVEALLDAMRQDEEIEGAYVKPPDALP